MQSLIDPQNKPNYKSLNRAQDKPIIVTMEFIQSNVQSSLSLEKQTETV